MTDSRTGELSPSAAEIDMKVGVLDMISREDCIGFCGLDESEVLAIVEHEHIPEIAAAALASYLGKQPHGGEASRGMIVDDILALN